MVTKPLILQFRISEHNYRKRYNLYARLQIMPYLLCIVCIPTYKERCVDCFQSTVSCQTCTFINSPQLTFAEDSSIGHWLLVTGYWSLETGRWALVPGRWFLVTRCWKINGIGCQEFGLRPIGTGPTPRREVGPVVVR